MRKRGTCEGSCTEWRPNKRSREISLGGVGGGSPDGTGCWGRGQGGAGRGKGGARAVLGFRPGLEPMGLRRGWGVMGGGRKGIQGRGCCGLLFWFLAPFCFLPVAWTLGSCHLLASQASGRPRNPLTMPCSLDVRSPQASSVWGVTPLACRQGSVPLRHLHIPFLQSEACFPCPLGNQSGVNTEE